MLTVYTQVLFGCTSTEEENPTPDHEQTVHDTSSSMDTAGSVESETDMPTDHEYNGGVDYAEIDLGHFTADLQDLFNNLYRYNSMYYIDAYSTIIDQWGGDCPDPTDYGYMIRYSAPSGGCSTDTGMLFLGMLDVYRDDDGTITSLKKQSFAYFPDGSEAFLGGDGTSYGYNNGSDGDRRTWSSYLQGDFYNSNATEYDWMTTPHGAWIRFNHAEYHSGTQYFNIVGRMELDHGSITDLMTDRLSWKSSAPCLTELANNFWVRLEDGRWIEIRFDMVSNEWGDNLQLTGECDGCAMATLNGEELGEVCIDISPLLWEVGGNPWSH